MGKLKTDIRVMAGDLMKSRATLSSQETKVVGSIQPSQETRVVGSVQSVQETKKVSSVQPVQETKVIGSTQSVCPDCLSVIDARKVAHPEGIFLEKTCLEHGSFTTLIWEGDCDSYLAWDRGNTRIDRMESTRERQEGCPYDCGLCLEHERQTCCVLLEVTTRCNLCCPVCFASAGAEGDTSLEDIASLYDILCDTGHSYNIQLSGGEPTMRDDLPAIIRMGREKGFSFFQLNTNGLRLAEDETYVKELVEAGLSCVFLQFDGISEYPYETLRGKSLLSKKRAAIDACSDYGLGVVLVPTIAPGINDVEIGDILLYALKNMPTIRGVHFQPITYMGRNSLKPTVDRITIPSMLSAIEEQTEGLFKAGDFIGGGAENSYCSFHAKYQRNGQGILKPCKDVAASCCSVSSEQSRDYVARHWAGAALSETRTSCAEYSSDEAGMRGGTSSLDEIGMRGDTSSLDDFLTQSQQNSFTVSGMLFQDAYSLDLCRLKRCYICEVDKRYGLVPFCAYNLTNSKGRGLYRR